VASRLPAALAACKHDKFDIFVADRMCNNPYCLAYRLLTKHIGLALAKSVMQCLRPEWEKYLRLQSFDEFRRHMGPFEGQLKIEDRKWLEENPALYQLVEFVSTLQWAPYSSKFEFAAKRFCTIYGSENLIFSRCCSGTCLWRMVISMITGEVSVGQIFLLPQYRFDSLVAFIQFWLDETPDYPRRWCSLAQGRVSGRVSSTESDSD